jgi:hypothetical protein
LDKHFLKLFPVKCVPLSLFFEEKYCGGVPHSLDKSLNKSKEYMYKQEQEERREEGGYHYIKRYSPKTK